MAKIQTRRTISINRHVYDSFKASCAAEGVSMSGKCAELLAAHVKQRRRTRIAGSAVAVCAGCGKPADHTYAGCPERR